MEPEGYLDMLYVHPEFQRCGVASALVHCAETSARARGVTTLSTEASLTARPFFERHGFHLVATQTVVRRGQPMRNFRMTRPVS
jgi:putative acetyltransferase